MVHAASRTYAVLILNCKGICSTTSNTGQGDVTIQYVWGTKLIGNVETIPVWLNDYAIEHLRADE